MKNALITLLALALAATAFGYEVYYYNGSPCRHESWQMPWVQQCNDRGTPDCANEWSELATAMATWTNCGCHWWVNQRGADTGQLNHGGDGINLCVFYEPEYSSYGQGSWPWGSSAIAVNEFWIQFNGSAWVVMENDQCYNGYNYLWSDAGAGGRMDVQNISAHELGHDLVLKDLYSGYAAEYTMYGYAGNGEVKKRDLHQDDIDGIRFLYGTPGIRLESFNAAAHGDNVDVTWRTAAESDLAGFNLYRASDGGAAASCRKVNDALITGRTPYAYRDADVPAGSYKYILEAVDLNGHKERFGPAPVEMGAGAKRAFNLASCYPNPARDAATFKFTLPAGGDARLAVYDLSGRLVATPASGPMGPGEHEVTWNLAASDGSRLTPGVYFYRLEAAGDAATRRLVVSR